MRRYDVGRDHIGGVHIWCALCYVGAVCPRRVSSQAGTKEPHPEWLCGADDNIDWPGFPQFGPVVSGHEPTFIETELELELEVEESAESGTQSASVC